MEGKNMMPFSGLMEKKRENPFAAEISSDRAKFLENIAAKKKLFGILSKEDEFLAKESGILLTYCYFEGKSALSHSTDIIINGGGDYKGDDFAWDSRNMLVNGGNFPGKYAFGKSGYTNVRKGNFPGDRAFYASLDTLLEGGNFSGRLLLEKSENAVVAAREIESRGAFHQAENLECYVDHLSEVHTPKSGFIVAERIDNIVSAGKAHVYAVEVGNGSEHATLIEKEDLEKFISPEDIEECIGRVVAKYGDASAKEDFAKLSGNYWKTRRTQEREVERKRIEKEKERIRQEFHERLSMFPQYKDENDVLLNFKKIGQEESAIMQLADYLAKHGKKIEYACGNSDYVWQKVDEIGKKVREGVKQRILVYTTIAAFTIASPFIADFLTDIHPSNEKNLLHDIREAVARHDGDKVKTLIGAYTIACPNRSLAGKEEVKKYLKEFGAPAGIAADRVKELYQ